MIMDPKKNTQMEFFNKNTRNLFYYEGPFYIDLLTIFGNHLKIYTNSFPLAQKKLFKIYVELTQNVSYYSEEYILSKNDNRRIGMGEMQLTDHQNQYYITTKNIVKLQDANILSQRCEIINSSSKEYLKELKRELRKSSPGEKYGARIGLVSAKLISKNNIDYSIIENDRQYSLFKITAKIDKNETY